MANQARVTHLKTKGFKGFDLDEDIPEKALYVGKNTSGKSTKAAAIALVLHGSIPFATNTSKRPGDILSDFGQGNTLTVSVIYGGVEFERKFSRSEKGVVSQLLRVDKQKHNAADFAVALSKAGSPKIVDVADFMASSEQKKIDTLFTLYPNPELKNLDNQIEKAKKTVSAYNKDQTASTVVIQRLTKSKNELKLPAQTLAEAQGDIKDTLQKIKDIDEKIKAAQIAEAEAKATEKAEAKVKADAEAKIETATPDQGTLPSASIGKDEALFNSMGPGLADNDSYESDFFPEADRKPGNQRIVDFAQGRDVKDESYGQEFVSERLKTPDPGPQKVMNLGHCPATSIQKIIDTLVHSGCEICAGLMVAKQELKKFATEKKGAA